MRIAVRVFGVALVWGWLASGAHADTYSACSGATNQMEMNRCAYADYAAADDALNVTYRRVMADLDDHGRDTLRMAERDWIRWRDSECGYQSSASEGGSIQPLERATCLARVTRNRIRQLETSQPR